MRGFYRRYFQVVLCFLPFAFAFLRDRNRFLLFGPSRRVPDAVHRERAERMTDLMLELGPAFIKVGQVLSTRPDIVPPAYTETFATLQDEVPEDVGGDPLTVLEAELGGKLDLETLEPIAGGSLAYVYTVAHDGDRLALKVRRPGIRTVIERDLRVIGAVVPVIAAFAPENQRYSLENVADDFEEIILEELDFEREARMMEEIAANVDESRVHVPAVYEDLSSERVLAMEYVDGAKITDEAALETRDIDRTDLATLIARTYLKMGLVDGVYHADPHPGNLAVADDGRLVIYDFGMCGRLSPSEQDDVARLYRALVRRDVDGLLDTLIALEVLDSTVDRAAVRNVLRLVIENLEGRSTITWRAIITELMTMLHDFPFRIPPDVMLLIRVGSVGEGVCRSLDPDFDFIDVTRQFLVDHGIIESELQGLLEDLRDDLRQSVPVLAGAPARFDRVFGQLERGELVVRTESVDADGDDRVGYAVIAAGLAVAAAVLTFHEQPYELLAMALAVGFLLAYVRRRLV